VTVLSLNDWLVLVRSGQFSLYFVCCFRTSWAILFRLFQVRTGYGRLCQLISYYDRL